MGGDQLQPGVEDGETPTEVVAENKKTIKRRKQENSKKRRALGAGYPNTTPHSLNTLTGVGGDQLQPGVEPRGQCRYFRQILPAPPLKAVCNTN